MWVSWFSAVVDKPTFYTMEELEVICGHKRIAKTEYVLGVNPINIGKYRAQGCYECDGFDTDCDKYTIKSMHNPIIE